MAPVGNPSLFLRFVSMRYRARQQHLVGSTTAPGLTGPAAALLVAVRLGGELPTLRSAGEHIPCDSPVHAPPAPERACAALGSC
jgi:hypothetical protein